MNDADILKVILHHTSEVVKKGFIITNNVEAKWDVIDEKWIAKDLTCCCLSAVLLSGQKIPDFKKGKSDSLFINTVAVIFDKSSAWVESFVDGIDNKTNSHTSISGYMMGFNMRKHLL